ncbi:MAG: cyclic nucleotide-binding domain-containing protein [Spirochaetales bacterium]|nr:cyclic nucleotide-binding domain-containing protein [Spirochaetales bacterium]
MSLLGILNTDPDVDQELEKAFGCEAGKKYRTKKVGIDEDEIYHFLNFDLPELIVVNFSDPGINIHILAEKIRSDSWLHNFGIIGIYDRKTAKEAEILKQLNDINVLSLLDKMKIPSHLVKLLDIVERNRQIIFHMELTDKLVERATGSFSVPNDPLDAAVYAGIAATTLFQRRYIDAEEKVQLQVAISELLLNGIEHGNCKISYAEKSEFLGNGGSMIDLIAQKCEDPKVSSKRVFFEWEIGQDSTRFVIRDEGDGFDVDKYKDTVNSTKPEALHGRGILMARMLAEKLYYNTIGNTVVLVISHKNAAPKNAPDGFSQEEVVFAKKGDILFQQGEDSDFLYYISSGTYSVYNGDKIVGKLTPADIFVGEMSFLLNNTRSATVVAEKKGKLVKISRQSFIAVIKKYPHYGLFLSKLLARKLVRANNRWIAEN